MDDLAPAEDPPPLPPLPQKNSLFNYFSKTKTAATQDKVRKETLISEPDVICVENGKEENEAIEAKAAKEKAKGKEKKPEAKQKVSPVKKKRKKTDEEEPCRDDIQPRPKRKKVLSKREEAAIAIAQLRELSDDDDDEGDKSDDSMSSDDFDFNPEDLEEKYAKEEYDSNPSDSDGDSEDESEAEKVDEEAVAKPTIKGKVSDEHPGKRKQTNKKQIIRSDDEDSEPEVVITPHVVDKEDGKMKPKIKQDTSEDPDEVDTTPVEDVPSEKPKKSISSFFQKVSKEDRLKKVEVDNSKIEVKVMIHQSTKNDKDEEKEVKESESPEAKKVRRKPRKSNVARPAAEGDNIEVIEVHEEKEEEEVEGPIVPPKPSMAEAAGKLFGRKVTKKEEPIVDEVKEDLKQSNKTKEPKQLEKNNEGLTKLFGKRKENAKGDAVKENKETELSDKKEGSAKVSNKLFGKRKDRVKVKNTDPEESEDSVCLESPVKMVAVDKVEHEKDEVEVLTEPLEEDLKAEIKEQVNDISKKADSKEEVVLEEPKNGKVKVSREKKEKVSNKLFGKPAKKKRIIKDDTDSDDGISLGSCSNSPKKTVAATNGKKNTSVKSAFSMMMDKSRKPKDAPALVDVVNVSDEAPEKEDIPEIVEVEKDVSEAEKPEPASKKEKVLIANNAFSKLMKKPEAVKDKDPLVQNMMSVLESVKSDSEEDREEGKRRRKERRRLKRARRATRESSVMSSSSSRTSEEEQEEEDIEEEVVDLWCKGKVAKLHPVRYVTDTEGLSVHHEKSWLTPRAFQKLVAPKASKYEVILFVQNQPLHVFFASKEEKDDEEVQELLPLGSRSSNTTAKRGRGRPKKEAAGEAVVIKDAAEEDVENEEDVEDKENTPEDASGCSGRRSGRIAKTANILQERRKREEELDQQLRAREKKEKMATKKKHSDIRKALKTAGQEERRGKRKRQESSVSVTSNSSSDCEVEKVVVKKKTASWAAIFQGKKKEEPVVEDPEVVARRKAFLMSSTPEILRNRVEAVQEEDESGEVVFPSEENIHVHQGQEKEQEEPSSLLPLRPTSSSGPLASPPVLPGQLLAKEQEAASCPLAPAPGLSCGSVLASLESLVARRPGFPVARLWDSFVIRRQEAESWETEAREKNLCIAEVEDRRIRGNRRRSRRSRGEGKEKQYKVPGGSGLMWTAKYQPRCGADVVGNTAQVAQLREWLQGWVGGRSKEESSGNTSECSVGTDSCVSGEETEPQVETNTALLRGPSGSGKTAAVYALAAELGFNVLEVNASSGRSGKQVLARLHEATQSQQVKGSRAGQGLHQDKAKRMKTALILFEDIDLVLEDLDDGFYSAVNTLIQQTKRPIVLTTANMSFHCVSPRPLRCEPELVTWTAALPREVAGHLQVLALAEGHSLALGPLVAMVEGAQCVRQAMLQLQLYCQSGDAAQETQEEEQEPQIDLKVAQPDVKNWFRHLDSKERRGGTAVRGRGLPRPPALPYSHALWWSALPQGPAPARHAPYPLEAGAGGGRIDPLRNKDLYDDEASEDETEVEGEEAVKDKVDEKEVEVTPVSRELMAVNKSALVAMTRHLDTLASQEEEGEAVALSACLTTSLLASLEPSTCPALREEVERGEAREEVLDSDLVVHRLLMGRRERVEVVAVVRGMARLEEGRRGRKDGSSRRGASKRFQHYFASQCDVNLSEDCLVDLCNSLC